MCVLIFSTRFVWNIFHSKKNLARYNKNVYFLILVCSIFHALYIYIIYIYIYIYTHTHIYTHTKPTNALQYNNYNTYIFFFWWRCDPTRVMASSFLRFLDHTQRRTTVGRTPVDEWSACRRDLYLTTHNTHNGQTSVPPAGFEPTIWEGERPQTHALDRAATGTGISIIFMLHNSNRNYNLNCYGVMVTQPHYTLVLV